MAKDLLGYETMVQEALRGVARAALRRAVAEGLPGDHHFYLTFRTTHPGVSIPNALRQRHPTDMTIVLQHKYWNLAVTDDGFSVTLTFNKIPSDLVVPFAALTAFADPSVQFGLQFEAAPTDAHPETSAKADSAPDPAAAEAGDKVVTLDAFRKK
ncbi:MAG: ClpXP protease specificity-enhancing factor SspB [Alphaproteobacteria bacterium]|jgi:hypothetical protein|nr:ClpXP protease specificity-enhancing factor SspB [Alphaproteobacteria bacterium]MDP6515292.1 ClpXP protease specificity-enhancing factor SspB [Alphaproteobacteria bacterium]